MIVIKPYPIDVNDMPILSRAILRLLEWLAGLAAAAFVLGLLCVFVGKDHPNVARNICFPLSAPNDVVAAANGTIFVALEFYSRIQVYGRNGRFQYGYFVNSDGGLIRLEIGDAGNLRVLPARGEWNYVYDRTGKLLSSSSKPQDHNELGLPRSQREWRARGTPFIDRQGRRYLIVSRLWNPRIIREDPTGDREVLIQTPLLLRPFVGPFPCWVMLLCAGLLHQFVKRRFSRRQQPVMNNLGQASS